MPILRFACLLLAALGLPLGAAAADVEISGEAGGGYDTNVNNWQDADETLESAFAFGNVAVTHHFWPAPAVGLDVRLNAGTELSDRYTGLSNARLGGSFRLTDRLGEGFYSPTFVGTLSVAWIDYDSALRDALDLRLNSSLIQQLSTAMALRGTFGLTWHDAHSNVFDAFTPSLSLNLDWRLAPRLLAYGGYQVLFGNIVPVGPLGSPERLVAEAKTPDDAFGAGFEDFIAYRINAITHVGTVGLNLGLSPHWALDVRTQYADAHADGGSRYQRLITSGSVLARF
jgi:hypothetical protein